MSNDPAVTQLIDKRYLTLVVRLLVDQQGTLQQGILIDLSEETIGQFRQLDELPNLIERWLETWGHKPNLPSPD